MHNPESVSMELAQKLASRNRHVVFLLGAGSSCAAGLPDLHGLKVEVGDSLKGNQQADYNRLADIRNLEEILTYLRQLAEILDDDSNLNGFTAELSRSIDRQICIEIARIILKKQVTTIAHDHFATWLNLSRYKRPVEIFTTNYDILIEKSLEQLSLAYFDGFVGTFEGTFRSDLVDNTDLINELTPPSSWIRLWKLHGSISWAQLQKGNKSVITRLGVVSDTNLDRIIAIYPSLQKYQESRRIPFVVLADRLRRALAIPETLCIISGYSFGDDHINELLFDAAKLYRASEVLALFKDNIPENAKEKAKKVFNLTLLGPSNAVIGGLEAPWQTLSSDSSFWKENAFTLGDFQSLTYFLLQNENQKNSKDVEN